MIKLEQKTTADHHTISKSFRQISTRYLVIKINSNHTGIYNCVPDIGSFLSIRIQRKNTEQHAKFSHGAKLRTRAQTHVSGQIYFSRLHVALLS